MAETLMFLLGLLIAETVIVQWRLYLRQIKEEGQRDEYYAQYRKEMKR